MATTTSVPFRDLISEHKLDISALPETTQERIAQYDEEKNEVNLKALDEAICGDIWDYIEEQEKKRKAEEKKKKYEELKKKAAIDAKVALDVSTAATAHPAGENGTGGKEKKAEVNKPKGFMGFYFGKK